MNESTEQKLAETPADVSKAADEVAALPLVDAPSIAPPAAPAEPVIAKAEAEMPAAPIETRAGESRVGEAKAGEAKPEDTKPAEAKSDEAKPAAALPAESKISEATKSAEAEFRRLMTSAASKRFRQSASVQITAARERISQRNLSGAMTVALAVGVLSAGVAGGTGYLAGLSEKSATHAAALEQSVLRIEAEMFALRSEVERASRIANASAGETGERLERIEKAQAEPLAKLGKLAEMVEKLRSLQPTSVAASRAESGDVTGSVSPQHGKSRVAAVSVVDAWVLREYDKDVALIEGKRGLLEIAVGDDIPGVGKVEGFRKHDGRWAVVTSKGLITSR